MKEIIRVVNIKRLEDKEMIEDYYQIRIYSLNGKHCLEQFDLSRDHIFALKVALESI